jgi:hypothetical protein
MKRSIFQIIKEEVENFFSDWQTSDEPSIADKYYEKYYGIDTDNPSKEVKNVTGDVIGYITTNWNGQAMEIPIPIYKNPRTLEGIGKTTRGILLNNGDLYLARTYYAAHEMILEVLSDKGIIPSSTQHKYGEELPKEFVAVQRNGTTNNFVESDVYHMYRKFFPQYYIDIFNRANAKHPFKFQYRNIQDEQQSPLDPNGMISNIPKGYDPNILYESNTKNC